MFRVLVLVCFFYCTKTNCSSIECKRTACIYQIHISRNSLKTLLQLFGFQLISLFHIFTQEKKKTHALHDLCHYRTSFLQKTISNYLFLISTICLHFYFSLEVSGKPAPFLLIDDHFSTGMVCFPETYSSFLNSILITSDVSFTSTSLWCQL